MKVSNQNIIPFQKREKKELSPEDQLKLAMFIATTSDDDIEMLSNAEARKKFHNDPVVKTTSIVGKAIPVLDSVGTALATPGSFATKSLSGLSTAADWGVFIVVTNLYSKLLNKSPKFKKFTEEHPVLSGAAFVASAVALGQLAIRGFNKLKHVVLDKTIKSQGKKVALGDHLEDAFRSVVDTKSTSKLNKNILEPIRKYFEKHKSFYGPAIKIGIVGLLVAFFYKLSQIKKNEAKNIENFKQARDNAIDNLLQ